MQDYHKAFIKLAHLIEVSEKHVISLFLAGLEEDLKAKVKLDMPITMISTYRSACARESITLIEKMLGRVGPYKDYKATGQPAANVERTTSSSTKGGRRYIPKAP